jgi:hypothetical protein
MWKATELQASPSMIKLNLDGLLLFKLVPRYAVEEACRSHIDHDVVTWPVEV